MFMISRRTQLILGSILMLGLVMAIVVPAAAEEIPPVLPPETIRGTVFGTGTHFEVTNSDYLNVTLDSSEPISLTLSSFPEQILLELSPVSSPSTALITLRGLTPLSTFYLYEDGLAEATSFTTDVNGDYVFVQDLINDHLVTIQPHKSTYFLEENTGGDCGSIGAWDSNTNTCTLTGDVYDTIEISSNDITLDGNGYTVSDSMYGIFIRDKTGVKIKNLNITSPSSNPHEGIGIYLGRSSNCRIEGVNISQKFYGIQTSSVHDSLISGNSFSNNSYGVFIGSTYNNIISNNIISNNKFWGIQTDNTYSNTFSDNLISNHNLAGHGGVFLLLDTRENTFYNNTITNNYWGIFNYRSWDNLFYNNSFMNNNYPAYEYRQDNIWNKATPDGGNYWSNYDEPIDGCDDINSDNFCDDTLKIFSFYTNSYDNLPWTTLNGWANQPPTVNAGGSYNGTEGTAITLGGASASDPDGDDLTYNWIVDSALCSFDNASALNPDLTCIDNGSFTATLTVSDGTESVNSAASVTVDNVAPAVGLVSVPTEPISVNNQPVVGISAPFTDPSTADTHICTVDYGDGTGHHTGTVVGNTCSGPDQSYTAAGVYMVTVEVTDDDGGVGEAVATTFIVIYDPDGGFVTGGGWIDSPANACADFCEGATGKANFGFVSKYKKGASTPTGQTEFQFKAGDLNFHSSSYDWLVVAGQDKAKYKGTGTINGSGNYGFMLTATDNGKSGDTFRIKIWDKDNADALIYDNQIVSDDDSYTGTVIGGGNIKVHNK
jgi:parallel beta-helix repeat protein